MTVQTKLRGYRSLCLPGIVAFSGVLACCPISALGQSAAADPDDEDVFVLSPFEVSSEENEGYRATSSLCDAIVTSSTSGCSGASTMYVAPNSVSGRVVNA